MIYFLLFVLFACPLIAETNSSEGPKIGVQNAILAKVNGTTVSMMDVKKKMDMIFHQHFSEMSDSAQNRYQFYEVSWRKILMEMIDHELILADASDKEIKIADAEVREEIENRFGPNVMSTLNEIGISYEEAWKMVKNEITVARMNWWFVQSKAKALVTPQTIRQEYRLYLKEHPARVEWKYRVITIRGGDDTLPKQLYHQIKEQAIDINEISSFLTIFEKQHPSCKISFSNEYSATDASLSDSHRTSLAGLEPACFSSPTTQISRDRQKLTRIFYLVDKTDIPIPTFEHMAPKIKNELMQKKFMEQSNLYLEKLRKHYRFDQAHLLETLPSDLHPFALQ